MSQIQSYYDAYELFTQIKNKCGVLNQNDWTGQKMDNYKLLNLSQQHNNADYWKKNIVTIISQYSSDIQSLIKSLKIKLIYNNFDPHNQISGFSQIITNIGWINASDSNGLIKLTDSFRIVETSIGKDTINLICCTTSKTNVGVCFIPIVPEIEKFTSQFGIDLSAIKYFDLLQIIHLLKTYIKRNPSRSLKSIKNLTIKPFEITSYNLDSCLNQLQTQLSGAPFTIVNIQQANNINLNIDGVSINQINKETKETKDIKDGKEINDNAKEDYYHLKEKYIMWIEDISLTNNIILAYYLE